MSFAQRSGSSGSLGFLFSMGVHLFVSIPFCCRIEKKKGDPPLSVFFCYHSNIASPIRCFNNSFILPLLYC